MIDLHTHSTASDGTLSPTALVAAGVAAGLTVMAITDHDTTGGWDDATTAALAHGIPLLRGVEITCDWGEFSVHLLGYLIDPDNAELAAEMERARSSRVTRMERMVGLLAADGIPISYAEVLAQVPPGATVGRPHLADALVVKGIMPDRDAVFAEWLANDGPYYVKHYAPAPVRAVELVRAAGGVAVHAHPFARTRGRMLPISVIEDMAAAGLAGLEVDHREHDEETRQMGYQLAASLGLFVTGSSDFHGAGKLNRLGENTTSPQVLGEIRSRATGSALVEP